jgi:hypothetical protein
MNIATKQSFSYDTSVHQEFTSYQEIASAHELSPHQKIFYVPRNDAAVVSFTVLLLNRSLLRHMNIHFS